MTLPAAERPRLEEELAVLQRRLAADTGQPVSEGAERELEGTLEAALVDADAAEAGPGRAADRRLQEVRERIGGLEQQLEAARHEEAEARRTARAAEHDRECAQRAVRVARDRVERARGG